jgi:transcriptional regulator with XRE-family HTH domain
MARGRVGSQKGIADPRYLALIGRLVGQRKALGLTQAALAARLGTHQQFVGRYEVGERRLDVVEFIDVALALNLDPAELFVY